MTVVFQTGYLLVQAGLFAVAATTLAWMLYAWRQDDSLEETRSRLVSGSHRSHGPALSFSLIVPARHEEAVLAATLETLAGLDHDRFEVLVVVGDDDPSTARSLTRPLGPIPARCEWWSTTMSRRQSRKR